MKNLRTHQHLLTATIMNILAIMLCNPIPTPQPTFVPKCNNVDIGKTADSLESAISQKALFVLIEDTTDFNRDRVQDILRDVFVTALDQGDHVIIARLKDDQSSIKEVIIFDSIIGNYAIASTIQPISTPKYFAIPTLNPNGGQIVRQGATLTATAISGKNARLADDYYCKLATEIKNQDIAKEGQQAAKFAQINKFISDFSTAMQSYQATKHDGNTSRTLQTLSQFTKFVDRQFHCDDELQCVLIIFSDLNAKQITWDEPLTPSYPTPSISNLSIVLTMLKCDYIDGDEYCKLIKDNISRIFSDYGAVSSDFIFVGDPPNNVNSAAYNIIEFIQNNN